VSRSGFTPLQKALETILQRLGLEVGMANVVVHRVWPHVVGEEVARRSQPGLLRKGRLQVTVADAVWLQQLTMLKPAILASLESHLGSRAVRDIFFTLGPCPDTAAAPRLEPVSRGQGDPPSPELEERLREILQPVRDSECREVLARILRKTWLNG
jgi:predicted nucleic acid-binding Zn ribbon protein